MLKVIPWSPLFQPEGLAGEYFWGGHHPLQSKASLQLQTLGGHLEGLTSWEQGMLAEEC